MCHSAPQVDSVFSHVLLLVVVATGLDPVGWESQREEALDEDVRLSHGVSSDYIYVWRWIIKTHNTQIHVPAVNACTFYTL